jgi:hypothetical protein
MIGIDIGTGEDSSVKIEKWDDEILKITKNGVTIFMSEKNYEKYQKILRRKERWKKIKNLFTSGKLTIHKKEK